jgi:hypothetical protein
MRMSFLSNDRRARFARTASVSALGVAMFVSLGGTALAQAAPAADDGDEIVVTGFRAALENATATKKKTETVVEIGQRRRHWQAARQQHR